jgi:hypothetical protein
MILWWQYAESGLLKTGNLETRDGKTNYQHSD